MNRVMTNLSKKHLPKIIVGVLWAILLWQLYAYQASHGMGTTETALMVFDFVSMTVWGTLVYILAYTIRPLAFFPATAITILSGVFFGFWGGFVLTVIAANISAVLAYGVGRFFGSGLALEDSVISNWVSVLRKNPFVSVLTMRLIFLPFDGVSYFAGILKIPLLSFSFATLLGTLLGIATFVSIGASISVEGFRTNGFSTEVIDAKLLVLSALIFIVSILLSRFLKRWRADAN